MACDPLICLIPLIAIGMFRGLITFMFGYMSSRSSDCTGSKCGPSIGGLMGGMMGIMLGGVFLIFLMVWCVAKRARQRLLRRNKALVSIISKHQQSTFANKNVIVRMSQQGSYVAIEFKWRVNNVHM